MDGQVIGLDGNYLIHYLQLGYPASEIPALLDDIHTLSAGWLEAQNPQKPQP